MITQKHYCLILCVLLVVSLVGVGFLWDQNSDFRRSQRRDYIFSKKQECQKYRSELAETLSFNSRRGNLIAQASGSESALRTSSLEVVFFSPKDNSCLYAVHTFWRGSGQEYSIHNALTGHKITSFNFPDQLEEYKRFLFEYSDGEIRL
ncbi:MAG: hypothetical protein WC654_06010 [Patescibacteria group bacterium]